MKLVKWAIYRIAVYRTLRKFYKLKVVMAWNISGTFYEQFNDNHKWGCDPVEDTHEEMSYWSE